MHIFQINILDIHSFQQSASWLHDVTRINLSSDEFSSLNADVLVAFKKPRSLKFLSFIRKYFHTFPSDFLKHLTVKTINFPLLDSAINFQYALKAIMSQSLKCLLLGKNIYWLFGECCKVMLKTLIL